MAAAYLLDDRLGEAITHGELSRAESQRTGDNEAALNAAATLGTVLVFAGRMDEGWQLLEDAIARARDTQQEAEAARGYRMIGSSASELMEYDRAERWLTEGIRYAENVELWNHRHYMASHLAHIQWATGQWDAATRTAQYALTDGRGGVTTQITAQYVLGFLAMGRGDWSAADMLLREALAKSEQMAELQHLSPPLWGLAESARCQGDYDTALTLCERGYQASADVTDAAYLFPFLITGVRAYLALGGIDAAEKWLNRVGAVLAARTIPGTLPAIGHARGLVLLARGDVSAARRHCNRRTSRGRPGAGAGKASWARLDLAEAAARARRRGEAALLLHEARTIAVTAGAALSSMPPTGSPRLRPWAAGPAVAPAERPRIRDRPARRSRPHQPADRRTASALTQDDLGTRHPYPHQTGRRAPRRDRGLVHDRPAGCPQRRLITVRLGKGHASAAGRRRASLPTSPSVPRETDLVPSATAGTCSSSPPNAGARSRPAPASPLVGELTLFLAV